MSEKELDTSLSEEELDISLPEVCLRCTVDIWNMSDDHKIYFSSVFRFEGGKWKLGYSRSRWFPAYSLYLVRCSDVQPNPFDVSVHVETDVNGRIVSVFAEERRFGNEFEEEHFYDIWCNKEEEILKAIPEFRRNGVLKFIVKLKVELEEKDSVVSQTKRSILEDVELSCVESLLENFQQMMIQGSDHDVDFRCSDQSFKAHSVIVCARSPVICTMLGNDMMEGRTRTVNIPDMIPEIFRLFLGYLYTGKLPELSFEVALPLYESGDQYAVLGLARRCCKYLVRHLTVQNACDMLIVADAHSDQDFAEKVIAYMLETKVPLTSDNWSAFSDCHPKLANKVLQRGWDVFLK